MNSSQVLMERLLACCAEASNMLAVCTEAVVYGSVACGCEDQDSDFDLLLVGTGKRIKNERIDITWRADNDLLESSWLGSELANHIAHYGVWLKGEGSWKGNVFTSSAAIHRKRGKVARKISDLYLRRFSLAMPYRLRLFEKIILEMYRLHCLYGEIPVPPRQLIDEQVKQEKFAITRMVMEESILGMPFAAMIAEILGIAIDEDLPSWLAELYSDKVLGARTPPARYGTGPGP